MKFTSLLLSCILLFAYVSRLYQISTPPEYYFDEVYHAFTAKFYAINDPKGYEWWHAAPEGVAFEWLHPPIAKLLQGFSIYMLGDNSFAWRLPSAIFGTLTVAAVYWLTKQLTENDQVSLLASFLASLDGLLLAQSRIAMNDIFVTFFMLCALGFFWRFYKTKHTLSLLIAGTYAGLSMGTKWSGLFILVIFYLWLVITLLPKLQFAKPKALITLVWLLVLPAIPATLLVKYFQELTSASGYPQVLMAIILLSLSWVILGCLLFNIRKFLKYFLTLAVLPVSIYILSFGQFWLQPRENNLETFIGLHHQIWWYQTHLEATHPWQSRPLEWILNLKPVWYFVKYQDNLIGNIFALANPAISWFGLAAMLLIVGKIVLSLLGAFLKVNKTKQGVWQLNISKTIPKKLIILKNLQLQALIFLVISYLLVWTPWLVSPRIMFFYHYTPAIPLLTIALAIVLARFWQKPQLAFRLITIFTLTSTVGLYIFFFPHWTGILLPKEQVELRYWFPSWKP